MKSKKRKIKFFFQKQYYVTVIPTIEIDAVKSDIYGLYLSIELRWLIWNAGISYNEKVLIKIINE